MTTRITRLAFGDEGSGDSALAEAATAAMRALTDKMSADASSSSSCSLPMTPDDVAQMCSFGRGCADGAVRANVVGVAGRVGGLLLHQGYDAREMELDSIGEA